MTDELAPFVTIEALLHTRLAEKKEEYAKAEEVFASLRNVECESKLDIGKYVGDCIDAANASVDIKRQIQATEQYMGATQVFISTFVVPEPPKSKKRLHEEEDVDPPKAKRFQKHSSGEHDDYLKSPASIRSCFPSLRDCDDVSDNSSKHDVVLITTTNHMRTTFKGHKFISFMSSHGNSSTLFVSVKKYISHKAIIVSGADPHTFAHDADEIMWDTRDTSCGKFGYCRYTSHTWGDLHTKFDAYSMTASTSAILFTKKADAVIAKEPMFSPVKAATIKLKTTHYTEDDSLAYVSQVLHAKKSDTEEITRVNYSDWHDYARSKLHSNSDFILVMFNHRAKDWTTLPYDSFPRLIETFGYGHALE